MPKIPSLKSIDLKSVFGKLVKNLSWLFFGMFVILLIMEFFEIKTSAQLVLSSQQPSQTIIKSKGARINFDTYNQVVQRIQQADSFQPTGGITRNPFQIQAVASQPVAPQANIVTSSTSDSLKGN